MKPPSQALAIVNLFCYGKVVETKLGGRNAPWVVCALGPVAYAGGGT